MRFAVCLLILPLLLQLNTQAQTQDVAQQLREVVEAMPLERVHPKYPPEQARSGREGWVEMSYVIEADGTVSNAIVEDSSGNKGLERSAIKAIEQWTYRPATENGQPVQQCESRVRFSFRVDKGSDGVTRKFRSQIKQGLNLLEEGKLDEVNAILVDMEGREQWNLLEDAWYNMLKATYHERNNQPVKQYQALHRALSAPESTLPKNVQQGLLQKKLQMEIQLNRYAEAQSSYERLQALDKEGKVVAFFTPYMEKIEARITGSEIFGLKGHIRGDKPWRHKLSRPAFSVTQVNGQLDKLDVRCKLRRITFSIEPDTVWQVPAKWGQCHVYVYGDTDASFTLLELPEELPSDWNIDVPAD